MKKRFISLDTETTGMCPKQGHRIVEIGCVEMLDCLSTGEQFHCYVNPERDMPQQAYRVHGLSEEFLKKHPVFQQHVDSFLNFIGKDTLVIHNASFDLKFLNFQLELLGYKALENPVIDTLKMARKMFPGSPASLDALCKRFSVSLLSRKFHGALLDAQLLADVFLGMNGGAQTRMFDQKLEEKIAAKEIKDLSKKEHVFCWRGVLIS